MRVLVASTRGAGHFAPVVPFVDGCLRAGHEVLDTGPPELAEAAARAGYPGAQWRPDFVLREQSEFASALAAEHHGIPHARIAIGLALSEELSLAIGGPVLHEWRPGLVERIRESPYLSLFPASLEDPAAPGPPASQRFRDPAAPASPARLPDWWRGDERPLVYVSFGSVAGGLPGAASIYAAVLEAVAGLPARVLLTTGHEIEPDALGAAPPGVHVARWVPQADVLGHASAVVCHGGSGTTLGALAAGLPLVVVPLFADQPLNAARVAAVGAGIAVEPDEETARGPMRAHVDPLKLREAIETVLADGAYGRAARALAAEMTALRPTDEAPALALDG